MERVAKNNYKDGDSRRRLGSIPKLFMGKFPMGYKNDLHGWGNYSKEELHRKNEIGDYPLLHLDLDFGNSCSLVCPHCFRRDPRFAELPQIGLLSRQEIIGYILEAKGLGLKSVKILGAGEPFENMAFLGFLEQLRGLGLSVSVFTKGHVIGSDALAGKFNAGYGIRTGAQLARKLKELDVGVLLGFNSFQKEMQEAYVGGERAGLKGYVEMRDNALLNLVDAGLNEYAPGKETRLGLVPAPIKPENLDETFDIYTWGRRRNLYVLACPTTISGKGIDESERMGHFEGYVGKLVELYKKIYVWNIKNGLTSLERFLHEGVSLYPGCHPCNQTASGLYLTLTGKIIRCPGRADEQSTFAPDIREADGGLAKIWKESENYKRRSGGKTGGPEGNGFNYHCPARDGRSLPASFYRDIKEQVLLEIGK